MIGCGSDKAGTHFIDIYPTRKEVKQCDFNNIKSLPYRSNFFDEVICYGVLSHLLNPGIIMKEIHRILKPGGRVRIIADNASYWVFAHKDSLHRYGRLKLIADENYKTFALFTDVHLKNLLESFNFKVVALNYIHKQESSSNFFCKWIKIFVNYLLFPSALSYKAIHIEGKK